MEEILDDYLDQVKGMIQETGDTPAIVAFLVRERILEAECGSREEIKRAIGIADLLEAEWVCVVFTGWMKEMKPGEKYRYGDVARSPEKKEVLVGQIRDRSGIRLCRMFIIHRKPDEIDFEEIKGFDSFGGELSV